MQDMWHWLVKQNKDTKDAINYDRFRYRELNYKNKGQINAIGLA